MGFSVFVDWAYCSNKMLWRTGLKPMLRLVDGLQTSPALAPGKVLLVAESMPEPERMTLWSYRRGRPIAQLCFTLFLWLLLVEILRAQDSDQSNVGPVDPPAANIEQRIYQLEQRQSELVEQNRRFSRQLLDLTTKTPQRSTSEFDPNSELIPPVPSTDSSATGNGDGTTFRNTIRSPTEIFPSPAFDTALEFPLERKSSSFDSGSGPPKYYVGYDRGFVFRPIDPDESPFELKINGQDQIRYTGFEREHAIWTDGAGIPTTISNQSNFQIPRGRLILSGFTFRRELKYNLNIDYNTVGATQINFRAYWLAWRFSRSMTVFAGQSKVPGSREWLESFVNTLGADRSMATTFFRPSLSQGIWATGEPADGLFYHVMMSNGFNTVGATPQTLSSVMAFSGSTWWEPWGDFGKGYSDFEWHSEPSIRLGTSLTYSPEQGPQGSTTAPENSSIRLSNGTLITETCALAPGVTLNAFKIGLETVDLSCKYRGFSASTELFSQQLFGLKGSGPLPMTSISQYGGFVQGGYFVIPQKAEPYLRASYVTGPSGSGSEYAGGFNWYFLPGKQNLRFTFDAAWLDNNPATQNRTNLQSGQTGILVRSQIQIFF